MSILYIIATPIGNLEDITLRALRILKEVDLILCEDTRITKRLLERYDIKTLTLSYHQHSKLKKIDYIIGLLESGKNLALVSDAGTPCVSDPGAKLISLLVDEFEIYSSSGAPTFVGAKSRSGDLKVLDSPDTLCRDRSNNKLSIIPVPGPSAVTAAASISGFPMDKFIFMGFPPHKKKRKKFFEEVANAKYPVIFYESPYRIIKSLHDLRETDPAPEQVRYGASAKLNAKQTQNIVVARELTKKFETIYRGDIEKVIKEIESDKIRGEFVVIVCREYLSNKSRISTRI